MSLLLKGFDMPKACMNAGCPIDGKYCDLWWKGNGSSYGRNRNCPLVEVIHCKDCKWWRLPRHNASGVHICKKFRVMRSESDFCSRAERSEDEKKFVSVKRDITDFKPGLKVPGKLLPKNIKGGIILTETEYTFR